MIPSCSLFLLTGMDSQWPTGLELLFLNGTFYPTELPLAMLQQLLLPALIPFENPVQGVQHCFSCYQRGKPIWCPPVLAAYVLGISSVLIANVRIHF